MINHHFCQSCKSQSLLSENGKCLSCKSGILTLIETVSQLNISNEIELINLRTKHAVMVNNLLLQQESEILHLQALQRMEKNYLNIQKCLSGEIKQWSGKRKQGIIKQRNGKEYMFTESDIFYQPGSIQKCNCRKTRFEILGKKQLTVMFKLKRDIYNNVSATDVTLKNGKPLPCCWMTHFKNINCEITTTMRC